mgnify:CR=1 FL=1
MTIDLTGLVRPHLLEMSPREDHPNAAEFRLQPLERGFGYTLGNSLRRLLLSSLRGSAVWGFRLDGVVHEHQTVQGVLEDVHQIIQRLKGLTLVLSEDVDEAVLHIKKSGPGAVYARDIQEQIKTGTDIEVQKAKAELAAEAAMLAVDLAEGKIKSTITKQDHERIVKDYISSVGGRG